MTKKIALTFFTAGSLAAALLFAPSSPSVAQERSATSTDLSAQQQQPQRKAAPARRAQPQRAAPQRAAPRTAAPRRTAPRVAAPRQTAPRVTTPRRTAPRTVTRPAATPRTVTRPRATPRVVTQPRSAGPRVVAPGAAPRVAPSATRNVTAARLRGVPARGAGRAVVGGHRYSAWRSGYRVRHGSGWRTFVALGTLGAIAIGATQYYPYAYISAPQPYCEGFTEDGCELRWQDVETVEGDIVSQCVAYCPWR